MRILLSLFIVAVALGACKKSPSEKCWKCSTTMVTGSAPLYTQDTGTYEEVLCGKSRTEIEGYEKDGGYPRGNDSTGGNVVINGVTYNAVTGRPYGSLYGDYLISSSRSCVEMP